MQHDFNIANQGFPATRADLNNALGALATNSAGTTEPSTTYAYQYWYDETANLLKMRNAADDAWITLAFFDQTNDEWEVRSAVIQAVDSAGVVIKTDDGITRITVADSGAVTFANAVTFNSGLLSDTISERTSATGVTIDGVLLKDGDIEATDGTFSGGVYLGGTGAANFLDDYEEGTWTPTVGGSSGNPTSITASGHYQKIGNHVFVQFRITLSNGSGGSGYLEIANLPFTMASVNRQVGVAREDQSTGDLYAAYSNHASQEIYVSALTNVGAINWTTGRVYTGNLYYQVAD
jgi:hypothetical protein